jgi:hypothetical protein
VFDCPTDRQTVRQSHADHDNSSAGHRFFNGRAGELSLIASLLLRKDRKIRGRVPPEPVEGVDTRTGLATRRGRLEYGVAQQHFSGNRSFPDQAIFSHSSIIGTALAAFCGVLSISRQSGVG